MRWAALAASVAALGCAASGPRSVPPPGALACPVVDTAAGKRLASIVIDGRLVAERLPARREQEMPETYQLDGPEPAELERLPPERIDLLQFVRGPEAEKEYRLCPGGVAFLITTKPR